MATVVLAIGSSSCDAKETSHSRRKVLGFGTATFGKVGEKLTYETRNACVVAPSIAPSSFNDSGIDGDVQTFLRHDCSYAHDVTIIIRILNDHFKSEGSFGEAAAEVAVPGPVVLQRLTSGVPRYVRLRLASRQPVDVKRHLPEKGELENVARRGYSKQSETGVAPRARALIACTLLGVPFLAPCAEETTQGGFLLRDSAGVAIVESRVSKWD